MPKVFCAQCGDEIDADGDHDLCIECELGSERTFNKAPLPDPDPDIDRKTIKEEEE